jgi:DNA mismatch endonuclease (patch repair protein)
MRFINVIRNHVLIKNEKQIHCLCKSTHSLMGTDLVPNLFSKTMRSTIMAKIRSKDSRPERIVRKMLASAEFHFDQHRRDLPGSPDFVFPPLKKVIFVNGCFWHLHRGCRRSSIPKANRRYWKAKLLSNASRHPANLTRLRRVGWGVLIIWGCELTKTPLTHVNRRIT